MKHLPTLHVNLSSSPLCYSSLPIYHHQHPSISHPLTRLRQNVIILTVAIPEYALLKLSAAPANSGLATKGVVGTDIHSYYLNPQPTQTLLT